MVDNSIGSNSPTDLAEKKQTIQNLDERIKNLKSPAMRRKCESARNEIQLASHIEAVPAKTGKNISASPSSPTIMAYTDMTDAELLEITKYTNQNTQSNAMMNDGSGFCRPTQPPDYETAMKRIGSNNGSLEHKREATKNKRIVGRKSVTFSDQVVLVACANNNEEEYMPHPLLEKAFRQHSERSEQEADAPSDAKTNLCDLCHNQPAVSSEPYCSNCSFYMSRFRPKN